LYIAYYSFPAADEGGLGSLISQIDARIADLDGVHKLPAMPKRELYSFLASCSLLLYPSIFWETSCIAAIEAMACGTPVITTSYCALKETVEHQGSGILVKGAPRVERGDGSYWYDAPHTAYQDRYVEWVTRILSSPAEWQKLHEGALLRAQHYHYARIAAEWDAKLRELKATRSHVQTISACMIVRDGEDTLHRALKSIRSQVDEIIVCVDERTQDSTREIARQYTSQVFDFRWPESPGPDGQMVGSFAEARNQCIARASCDWVFWFDADEHVDGPLRRYARANCFNACSTAQVHIAAGVQEHADYPARFFRNGLGIRFWGRIHEQPELVLNSGIPKTFLLPDVRVVHDGYSLPGAVDERWERNHRYMAADLSENPERHISWFSYLRDCVSGAERMIAQAGGRMTQEADAILTQALVIWNEQFADPAHPWHHQSYGLYQRVLEIRGFPVFAFALAGSRDKAPTDLEAKPRRFQSENELKEHIMRETERLLAAMNPPRQYPFED
jgi:hypothetical protein